MQLTFEQLVALIHERHPGATLSIDGQATPKAVVLAAADLLPVAHTLFQDQACYFDMLSCITGIDNGVTANTMEVVYNFYSIPYNHHLMVKVFLPREKPVVASLAALWRTANWQEREVFDMFGIFFDKHPDLRRILLPADWEGHPLRKDYQQQTYYRNIKVDY